MVKVRFKKDTTNSFFGHFLYGQVLPEDHFLVRLKNEVPWRGICEKARLIEAYKGGGEYGPPPYPPEKILRMLLVPYLFNISEREAEQVVRFNLLAKHFVGLGVDELPPDHSTLTVFKDRLLRYQGKMAWENLFNQIIILAKKKGIKFGRLQIIDSTHTTADVNLEKDKQRKKKQGKPPRDPEASFKTKGEKEAYTKKGKKIKVKDQIYGYKTHASFNHKTNLVTSIKVTTAREDDGKQFKSLVNKDRRLGIAKPVKDEKTGKTDKKKSTAYTADKAYDDGDNHEFLKAKGLISAIQLKKTRTEKKDKNKEPWLKMINSERYQKSTKKRKEIEKKFGEEKKHHGFGRCRCLGLNKYAIQAYLTNIAVNLKRIILLTKDLSISSCAIVPAPG